MKKLRVAVVFGGRSGEHEVSLVSAASIIKALDPSKYEVLQIGIGKDGKWMVGENCLEALKREAFGDLLPAGLSTDPVSPGITNSRTQNEVAKNFEKIDIAFPVLHGPYGEDGTIQGLFEMLQIPYVGCNVLASALAMDKLQCKKIWQVHNLPVVDYLGFGRYEWKKNKSEILEALQKNIGIPSFVKPANMGSSVGITKVKKLENLPEAIDLAAEYDSKILVEKAVNVREIECALLGNDEVLAGPVGEVIVGGEFYDFYDKYVNGVSTTEIPAKIPEETAKEIQELCIKAYKALDCSGLARCDTFLDRDSGEIYLNEINTMPGFTSISMYPKMMEAHGIKYAELIDRLIELGLARFQEKQKNQIEFQSGSEWYKEN